MTAGAGSLPTVDLLRWAIHLNAAADMLVNVDIAYPTLDLASLLQIQHSRAPWRLRVRRVPLNVAFTPTFRNLAQTPETNCFTLNTCRA